MFFNSHVLHESHVDIEEMRAVDGVASHGSKAGERAAGSELRRGKTRRIHRVAAVSGNIRDGRSENRAVVVQAKQRGEVRAVDDCERKAGAEEPVAGERPASEDAIGTVMESRVAEGIGEHEAG